MGGYIFPIREGYPQWKQNYDFNIQVDVTSSKYVLDRSRPTLVPLTLTVETFLRRAYLDKLKKSDKLCRLIADQADIFDIDEKYSEKFGKTCSNLPDDLINFQHDPLTIAIALGWNTGVEIRELPLSFTVEDTWLKETIDHNSTRTYPVVSQIDGKAFSEFWLERVTI
jgi:inosine-uridine nucleoside N-ribohydrolase